MQFFKVSHFNPLQLRLPPEPQPAVTKALARQAVLFAGGVATFAGLYEWATPLLTWATNVAPTYVLPARAGAAAAIGAFGGAAAVLMESTYDTVTAAYVATKRDANTSFGKALHEAVEHQQDEMPRELLQDAATAGGAGAALGVLASFLPDTAIWASVSAVAVALTYGVGSFIAEASGAVRAFRRAKRHDKRGDTAQGQKEWHAVRERLRLAGRAALESTTVAAVAHQVIGQVGHLLGHATMGHDPAKASQVVVTAADQIPAAVESIAEVAEAVVVHARETRAPESER